MNKLISMLLCVVLLSFSVVAMEWDNVKSYDSVNREATITNSLGMGSDIAKVKLLSPDVVYVVEGKNRLVAEMELWLNPDFYDQYKTTFKEITAFDTYDLRKSMERLDRGITMKYASKIETVYYPTYKTECTDSGKTSTNGSKIEDCTLVLMSNESSVVVKEWSDFDDVSKLPSPVRIGLFTDVLAGDRVEWVPELFGVKVDEWATWSATLNNNLLYYYRMNQSTVNETNIIGSYGELLMSGTSNVAGKYQNAMDFSSGDYVLHSDRDSVVTYLNETKGTINFWLNWGWQSNNIYGFMMFDDGSLFAPSIIMRFDTRTSTGLADNRRYLFSIDVNNGGAFTLMGKNGSLLAINDSGWHMLTIRQNGSRVHWYLDGVRQVDDSFTATTNMSYWWKNWVNEGGYKFSIDTRSLGGYARFVGAVDEWMMWSRALDESEITDLWNSGTGIFYSLDFTEAEGMVVNLLTPTNNNSLTSVPINFTANITSQGAVNLTNATLWLWNSAGVLLNTTNLSISGNNMSNFTSIYATPNTDGRFYWNVLGCGNNATGARCVFNEINYSFLLDTTSPAVTITQPTSVVDYLIRGRNLTLNWTFTELNPNTCKYYYNSVNHTVQCWRNTTLLNITIGTNTVAFYMNDTFGNYNYTAMNWSYRLIENNQTYNSESYEGQTEEFYADFSPYTPISKAIFYYNGIAHSANVTGNITNTQMFVPLANGLYNHFWSIIFNDGYNINTTARNQTVQTLNLTICQPTNNVPFLNMSYKNETIDQETIKAFVTSSTFVYWISDSSQNKTYTYQNTTPVLSHPFCISPVDRTIYASIYYSFDNSESEQRVYQNQMTLTNGTTNVTLFLLPTSEGIYVTFQVINIAEQPLSGASVTLYRTGFGQISKTATSDSGTTTVFLNPNYQYILTVEKAGYTSFNTTQAFTDTSYTVTLGGEEFDTTDYLRGVTVEISPKASTLTNRTTYNFNMTLLSTYWTLDLFGFSITNSSGYLLANVSSTNETGGFVSLDLNTANETSLILNHFWLVNGSYVNVTTYYGVYSGGTGSIYGFFERLKTYKQQGIFGMNNFTFSIIIFLIIFLTTGILSYKFGLESPMAIMAVVTFIIGFFDVGLGMITAGTAIFRGAPTLLSLLIFIALMLRRAG